MRCPDCELHQFSEPLSVFRKLCVVLAGVKAFLISVLTSDLRKKSFEHESRRNAQRSTFRRELSFSSNEKSWHVKLKLELFE